MYFSVVDSVVVRENTVQRKPIFWHILHNVNRLSEAHMIVAQVINGLNLQATQFHSTLKRYSHSIKHFQHLGNLQKIRRFNFQFRFNTKTSSIGVKELRSNSLVITEAHFEPSQTSMMELFMKKLHHRSKTRS